MQSQVNVKSQPSCLVSLTDIVVQGSSLVYGKNRSKEFVYELLSFICQRVVELHSIELFCLWAFISQ